MYLLSATSPSCRRILKPVLPTVWLAASGALILIPSESYTPGNTRHTLSSGRAKVATFVAAFDVVLIWPAPPEPAILIVSTTSGRVAAGLEAQPASDTRHSIRRPRIGP